MGGGAKGAKVEFFKLDLEEGGRHPKMSRSRCTRFAGGAMMAPALVRLLGPPSDRIMSQSVHHVPRVSSGVHCISLRQAQRWPAGPGPSGCNPATPVGGSGGVSWSVWVTRSTPGRAKTLGPGVPVGRAGARRRRSAGAPRHGRVGAVARGCRRDGALCRGNSNRHAGGKGGMARNREVAMTNSRM